jgi:DNA polymerase I-like protein with 3'-5' exonuclease and polymerase domains
VVVTMRAVALDFETHAIDGHVPPEPVGFAYAYSIRRGSYQGFGHPGPNQYSEGLAKGTLRSIERAHDELWFHNAGFDVPVAHRWGVKLPWSKVRDTQILAFLGAPLATPRGLKALCESQLGIKPTERDALWKWIRENVAEARRLGDLRLGAYIAQAPCDLVAPYAAADVTDVLQLRKHWRAWIGTPAYDREHAMLPILDAMRQKGIPIARRRLARDAETWETWLGDAEHWIKERLGLRDIKPSAFVAACEAKGLVDEWIQTRTGGDSIAAESLEKLVVEGKFHDPALVAVWGYRTYLKWMLGTFVRPWLAGGGDFVHPTWHAVFKDYGGAVTGRLSSRPNAQNLPKRLPVFALPPELAGCGLPNIRAYIEAPRGMTFVGVDISQQELRILGHFVPSIGDWYRENPALDLHARVRELIRNVSGTELSRDHVKVVNFCTIYGGGANAISEQARITYGEARTLKRLHGEALPGIARWDWEMHKRSDFFTAGGRRYTSVDGKEYRDRNYAIQGSAADQLKELMIAADEAARSVGGWLPLTAHDELLACVPTERAKEMRAALTQIVESTGVGGSRQMFDVPMRGETYQGKRWVK